MMEIAAHMSILTTIRVTASQAVTITNQVETKEEVLRDIPGRIARTKSTLIRSTHTIHTVEAKNPRAIRTKIIRSALHMTTIMNMNMNMSILIMTTITIMDMDTDTTTTSTVTMITITDTTSTTIMRI